MIYLLNTSFCLQFYCSVVDRLSDVDNIDLIACLNLLDRCADPYQILEDIHRALAPNGRVIVALVLPYSHYVETSMIEKTLIYRKSKSSRIFFFFSIQIDTSHMPIKPLLPHWPTQNSMSFDQEANSFFEQLEMVGFQIEAWTKAPYLCEGDLRQSFYWLVDIVVVLSKRNRSRTIK